MLSLITRSASTLCLTAAILAALMPGGGRGYAEQQAAGRTRAPRAAACPATWTVAPSRTANAVGQVPNADVAGPDVLQGISAISTTDVWAVGYTSVTAHTLIEQWDGTLWRVVPSPSPGRLAAVAASAADDIWAVGAGPTGTLIEHWDGAHWRVVPSPASGTLAAITAVTPRDVWAVGSSPTGTLIEHWDGASWRVVPSPSPGAYANILLGVAAVAAGDVWAVGQTDGPGYQRVLIEHWDGRHWTTVPRPTLDAVASGLRAVAAISPADVWAVGYAAPGHRGSLFEHWDGHHWHVVAAPATGAIGSGIAAGSARDVWAVGNSTTGRPLFQHWDGAAWSILPDTGVASATAYPLTGLAVVSPTDVWAVGAQTVGSTARTSVLVEHYAAQHSCHVTAATPRTTITPASPSSPQPGAARYFPQTRHSLGDVYLAFWIAHGGLDVFGYPRTEPFVDNARWTQVNDRFALQKVGDRVTVAPLGRLLLATRVIARIAPFPTTASRHYFSSTGHSLTGSFLTYWRTHAQGTLLGAPLTEPAWETNGDGSGRVYLVQWFENGRLEYHPALRDRRYTVEVGLVGRQVLQRWGWLP